MVTVPSLADGEWEQLDPMSRWLIASRFSVLFMTFMSAALGDCSLPATASLNAFPGDCAPWV
jgi:hypothetical protein